MLFFRKAMGGRGGGKNNRGLMWESRQKKETFFLSFLLPKKDILFFAETHTCADRKKSSTITV
jgi:hypothetical protein